MRRRRVGGKSYRRRFQKASKRTKAVNSPSTVMRGGFRL